MRWKKKKQHLTWRQMLGAFAGAGVGLAGLMSQVDVFSGLNRIWWAAVGGLVLVFGMAAYDKWRDERN